MDLSVIIPSRDIEFTAKTVDDIFANARLKTEVILMLDGVWPDPPLKEYPNLTIVRKGTALGMRDGINRGVAISRGKYIMKCDNHCAFGEGFDEILKADCEENWVCVPSRYSLDPIAWKRTRGPINYLFLTYPYIKHDKYGYGFHGSKWLGPKGLEGSYWHLEQERKKILIDDLMIMQGSCYFMTRKHWDFIEGLDEVDHHSLFDEAPEIDFKTWLSGGRVIRNKKTWYAHLHRGAEHKRAYHLQRNAKIESAIFNADYWMNNKWPKQTRPLKWLIDKFQPLDGWPENWEKLDMSNYDYNVWYER